MRKLVLLVAFSITLAACGGDSEEETPSTCEPTIVCAQGSTISDVNCAGCTEVSDGCGGTAYCSPAEGCTEGCEDGEYEVFDECPENLSCTSRLACGEEIICGDQSACLAEARCLDGGLPLDACPDGSSGCLPQDFCGVTKYCLTIDPCAQGACDPGEAPTILTCAEADTEFPCREITACGGTESLSCICAAQELECDPDEDFDTEPCVAGQECREVRGCGQVFYCKGDSI